MSLDHQIIRLSGKTDAVIGKLARSGVILRQEAFL
jgi:hypothetical protein